METITKKHQNLERNIIQTQGRLKSKNPNHPMLELVTVDDEGIHWTAEFGGCYEGMTVYDGLKKYVGDLKREISTN